ncbi:hypothetical protein [Clostridium frigidicarnis]|uniref:Uncharacterized protein n=1 Tax=Clostridium frigidicarnis TaxID=84698 RepID=A0A1I0YD53_9CLOT|nr:hypothetical protein [Clostridium frigidicarnis]SFB11295.1 hypothetical protein SAMN04488528_1012107 [Clostridium frigidicarnis]
MNKIEIKRIIKEWILIIDQKEILPEKISALNFGLYEQYGIYLIGSKEYDPENEDWACNEDFVPSDRYCGELNIEYDLPWEVVQVEMYEILKELLIELKSLNLFKVRHITMGFDDGELLVLK